MLLGNKSFVSYSTLSNVISFHAQSYCAWTCNISDSVFADPPIMSQYIIIINLLL